MKIMTHALDILVASISCDNRRFFYYFSSGTVGNPTSYRCVLIWTFCEVMAPFCEPILTSPSLNIYRDSSYRSFSYEIYFKSLKVLSLNYGLMIDTNIL